MMKDRRGHHAGVFMRYYYYHGKYQAHHDTVASALAHADGGDLSFNGIVDARTGRVLVAKQGWLAYEPPFRRPLQPLRAERYDQGYKRKQPKPKPKPLTQHLRYGRGWARYQSDDQWGDREESWGPAASITWAMSRPSVSFGL